MIKIEERLLTPNKYSRPQIKLGKVTKIVVHYVGNPGSTAINNRNYFDNLRITHDRYVSSHFVVGLQGEIIQCVPLDEVAYCSNNANAYSISIETCHPDDTGKFSDVTERALAELVAMLVRKFGLDVEDDVIRHFDVNGKHCPLWYVKHPEAWVAFKGLVSAYLGGVQSAAKADEDEGEGSGLPYKVRILDNALNVRAKPGTDAAITYIIKGGGVYTIVEERMHGSVKWGRLLSGKGWISLNPKYAKKY